MQDDEAFLRELVAGFVQEAEQLLQSAAKDLMDLEAATRDSGLRGDSYASLARNLHTLKGSAATCGLDEISDLAHKMEGTLAPFKDGSMDFQPECADLLLEAMDSIRAELHARSRGEQFVNFNHGRQALVGRLEKKSALQPEPLAVEASKSGPIHPSQKDLSGEESGAWRVEARQVMDMISQVERLRELSAALVIKGNTLQDRGIKRDAQLMAELSSALEERLKVVCMVPLNEVFDPLRRVVRDLCRRLGKAAQLSIVGSEIRVDRRLLETLKGALVHLLRNAVDHGLEPPEERDLVGKHHEGSLVIRAELQGNRLFLELSDDGAGIDPERVREAAARQGLATTEELATWDRHRLLQCLFRSGFSLAERVTEVSGRGVGLDAVRQELAAMGGGVEVDSRPGDGTRFTMSLPMEIGFVPVLLLRCGSQVFGLPLLVVDAVRKVEASLLHPGAGQTFVAHRDRLYPLRDLAELLGLRQASTPRPGQPLLVVAAKDLTVGLLVDEVLGHVELSLKPLPGRLAKLPAYQGLSQSAGGDPVLILRQEWLVDPATAGLGQDSGRRRALVVDDSLTARALHRAVLESAGYAVNISASGAEALSLLGLAHYDVVICDIAMQGMDGFEFLAQMRSQAELSSVPVIMVSAREEEAVKLRALEAGAKAFLSKKDCASGRLMNEVAMILERRKGARRAVQTAAAGGR